MSARRSIFKIILPLLSALFAIALVELALVLFYPIPYSLERNMYFEPDPHTGYRHRPLGEGFYPNGVEARANSLGFRDDEVTLTKAEGVFRILSLGDSFTVGANVEQDQAYPQVLEGLLNSRSQNGKRIEVINAGVGGYDTFHYAQFVEHYAGQYDPDLILIGFFVGNDTYSRFSSVAETRTAVLGRRVNRDAGKGLSLLLKVWAYENLNIARALVNRGPANIQFARESCDQFADYYLAVQEKRVVNHVARPSAEQRRYMQANMAQLGRIQLYAATNNIPMVVALLPDENQINQALQSIVIPAAELAAYDFDMPQTALRNIFEQEEITYVDLLEDFRSDQRCLYMDDTHWIAIGHALAAEKIAAFLTAGSYLP